MPRSFAIRSARKTFISDWYGTSRSFASDLSSSSMDAGSRKEIVVVDGLSWDEASKRHGRSEPLHRELDGKHHHRASTEYSVRIALLGVRW